MRVPVGTLVVFVALGCSGGEDKGLFSGAGGVAGSAAAAAGGSQRGGGAGTGGSGATSSGGSAGSGGGIPTSCQSDNDCTPFGRLCEPALGCVECKNAADCDAPATCDRGACLAPCANSLDCDSGLICDTGPGVCVECVRDQDCSGGARCIARSCKLPTGSGGAGGSGGTGSCGSPTDDDDGDGSSEAQGDCDDCDSDRGPGAYDWPGDGEDQDCSGFADDEPDCVQGAVDVANADPTAGAAAMELCRPQQDRSWGVIAARYVLADGSVGMNALSHGLQTSFGGFTPQRGNSLLVLSTGTARTPDQVAEGFIDTEAADMMTSSAIPPGQPLPPTLCATPPVAQTEAFDGAALEITLRVPSNVQGYAFDTSFMTREFPTFVCGDFNDVFAVLASPAPAGAQGGGVVFATHGSISSNTTLLRVCTPQTAGGIVFDCPLGPGLLAGTGFETGLIPGAATNWMSSQVPVQPGSELTLRFAVWDMGDHILESTVLLDGFRWLKNHSGPPVTQ